MELAPPSRRLRFQDLERVCHIDLALSFNDLQHEYLRIMNWNSADVLVSPVPLTQHEAQSAPRQCFAKPARIPFIPSDRGELMEIFLQVQQDAAFFAKTGIHILPVESPVRAQHAAICLAADHIFADYKVDVF